MKVLSINGSPHEKGCTFTALSEVAATLKNRGIDSEILYLRKKPVKWRASPCRITKRRCARISSNSALGSRKNGKNNQSA